jgi:hypothetical protein
LALSRRVLGEQNAANALTELGHFDEHRRQAFLVGSVFQLATVEEIYDGWVERLKIEVV